MKHVFTWIAAAALLLFTGCEASIPGDYQDSAGNKINLLGCWGLVEVQYKTAGVVTRNELTPDMMMEFAQKGIGYSKLTDGTVLDSFHYAIYRGSVTIYTNEEWENNRGLNEDDSEYERGLTYFFRIIDQDTIASEEWITANSSVTNVFARM